ncbi:phosphatase PAP2 family protein [Leekyejoonella antrihumi]|nr:phosphatase PAP2 family protein [Leekyejoonella antrihumi]
MSAPTRPDLATRPVYAERRAAARRAALWAQLVAMVALGIGALCVLVPLALHNPRGMRFDQRLMDSLGGSEQAWVHISDVLTVITIGFVGLSLLFCLIIAAARRRWAVAAAAVVLVAGANLTTEILKFHVFHRLPGQVANGLPDTNSLPSGHTTVSLSLVLAAVLVAPPAWRRALVPLGGFVATFVAAGTIAGHWHRPSDVVAGQAVCLGWAAIAIGIAVLLQSRRSESVTRRGQHIWLALIGSSLVGLVFVALGVRPSDGGVNLPMAMLALVPVGILCAVVVWWVSALSDRHVA